MNELLLSKKAKTPLLPLFYSIFLVLITLAAIYISYEQIHLICLLPQKSAIVLIIFLDTVINVCFAMIAGLCFTDYLTVSNTYLKIFDDHIEGKMRLRTKKSIFNFKRYQSVKFNQLLENCEIFYFKRKLWVKYDDVTGYLNYSIYDADRILTVLDK